MKTRDYLKDRLYGAVLGFAVADALGVPAEFKEKNYFNNDNKILGYIKSDLWGTDKGTWSDDTGLTLCTIDSLRHGYDLEDIGKTFVEWYYKGLWSVTEKPFDVGHCTYKSIEKLRAGISPYESGNIHFKSNGNGSLMRILPLIFHLANEENIDIRVQKVREVSSITHAHPISVIACVFYVEFGILVLKNIDPDIAYGYTCHRLKEYFKNKKEELFLEEFNRIFSKNICMLSPNEISNSSYVVKTLETVLWHFLDEESYKDVVLSIVNKGEDADTVAALTGGLIGLKRGISAIPNSWIKKLQYQKEIIKLLDAFFETL